MIVCKFGGTSVANEKSAKNIKDIINEKKNRKIIVVSALGKTITHDYKITDKLFHLYNLAKNGKKHDNIINDIFNRYTALSESLNIKINWEEYKIKFKEIIQKGNYSKAFIVSRGEYYSAILYSKFLNAKFLDAKDYIKFDAKGKLNERKTKQLLCKLDLSKKYVIGGYYGSNNNGEICVFDRGGSDITGAIICKCLGFDLYENYTDVDGVYDKNPNVFAGANNLPLLSYKTALGMADGGNEVVHKDALKITKNAQNLLLVKSTNNYKCLGSIVVDNNIQSDKLFICVSSAHLLILKKITPNILKYLYVNADILKIIFDKNKYLVVAKSFYVKDEELKSLSDFDKIYTINTFLFFSHKMINNIKKIKKILKNIKKYAIFANFLSNFNNFFIICAKEYKNNIVSIINKHINKS